MQILFFILVLLIAFITLKRSPGITLAYIVNFQVLNNIIFTDVGLEMVKDISTAVLLPLIFLIHYDKNRFRNNLDNFKSSKITIGFFVLLIYMTGYTFYLGGSYELFFLRKFIFPGIVTFIVGALFFFNDKMYKDFFYGIIIFSILTFLSIILFKGFGSFNVAKEFMGETTGISSIQQGRRAGLLALLSIMIIAFKKGTIKYWGIILFVFSIFWLSLTGTRGALVSLIAVLLFYLFFTNQRGFLIRMLVIAALFAVPLFIAMGLDESLLVERSSELTDPGAIESMQRFQRWLLFFEWLPDHIVFGLGPAGWSKYVMLGDYRYAHNIIIEFFLDYGLVGITSFLMIFLTSFRIAIYIIRDKGINMYVKSFALSWIYFAAATMFSGGFIQGNGPFFDISAILIGLGVFYRGNTNHNHQHN